MFDQNGNFLSTSFGRGDRLGHTTPDCDASDPLQPFLPKSYPAPWLPVKRRDDAHPAMAGVVVSTGNIVGVDKSGYLIPAGMLSGAQPEIAAGGQYYWIQYGPEDVGFTRHVKTGALVTAAECVKPVLIAAPSDADPTNDGELVGGVTYTAEEIDWALACDIIPGGVARGIGYALRNMWQNIFGVKVRSTAGGILYEVNTQVPQGEYGDPKTAWVVANYAHEMGNAVRTSFQIRVPWIGATTTKLAEMAAADSITGYEQTPYSKSFSHFTGTKGNAKGQLFPGCLVVPSTFVGDAGNYMPYDPAKHEISSVVGRVHGIEHLYPIRDYADRVRTAFERHESQIGPMKDRNPVTGLMGGSATRGIPYQVSVGTNGLFRKYIDQGKAAQLVADVDHEAIYSTVLIRILL